MVAALTEDSDAAVPPPVVDTMVGALLEEEAHPEEDLLQEKEAPHAVALVRLLRAVKLPIGNFLNGLPFWDFI